jgi:purine-binding chemotaxis protein CheW
MVVDSVSDVVTLTPDQIKACAGLGRHRGRPITCIGLGTVGERMLILLDIDKLLGSEEMGLLAAARTPPERRTRNTRPRRSPRFLFYLSKELP